MLGTSTWQSALQMPQIAIIVGGLVLIAGIVCAAWYKVQKTHSDNDLKHKLMQRGMSADEIERIIAAGQPEKGL